MLDGISLLLGMIMATAFWYSWYYEFLLNEDENEDGKEETIRRRYKL